MKPAQPNPKNPLWSRREALLLAAIVAVGVGLRLAVAARAPWYWDEGYMVEAAQSLARFQRPHLGGLWEDGFFPLSTPLLAPLCAAPFAALLPAASGITAVRLWAVSMEALALLLLARLGRRLGGPSLGLAAAGLYAVLPFAVEHGGRGFYHHLAVVFLLASLTDGLALFQDARPSALSRASLWGGLAAATAYWLWWFPLLWSALLVRRRPKGWNKALPWVAAGPLVVLLLNAAPDPAGAWWSIRCMLRTSTVGGLHDCSAGVKASASVLLHLPFLPAGLAGLGLAAWRRRGAWAWLPWILALAVLEPIRQRGDISALPYPFQLAAPLAALGAAWLAVEALRSKSWAPRVLGALALGLALWPVSVERMDLLSFDPAPVKGLAAYFDGHAQAGDGVCGMPEFNWFLGPRLRTCEPFDVGVAEGRASGFYLPGAPASRLAWPCRTENLRYAVLSRVLVLGVCRFPGVSLTYLEMERQGWRKVFDNKTFKVYENPRFGAAPNPGVSLLAAPEFYRFAARDAAQADRPAAEAYALAHAAALEAPARP